jgi:DNA-directed RNA polymerase specialized sigma subunit
VAAYIDEAVHERRETAPLDHTLSLISEGTNPEDCTLGNQRIDLMVKVLRALSRRDREILTRFYLQEQSQEQICRDMKLSETQFRLLKSRAKARFGALGRKKLQGRQTAPTIFVRTIAGLQH